MVFAQLNIFPKCNDEFVYQEQINNQETVKTRSRHQYLLGSWSNWFLHPKQGLTSLAFSTNQLAKITPQTHVSIS